MKIKYDQTEDDLVEFHSTALMRAKEHQRVRSGVFTVLAAFATLVGTTTALQSLRQDPAVLVVVFICLIVVAVVMTAAQQGVVRRHIRWLLSDGGDLVLTGPRELELTDTHLTDRGEAMEVRVTLDAVRRVEVSGRYAFAFISPGSGFVIPLGRITEGDGEAFVAELRKRCPAG